jgi:hypothetical protein
LNEVLPAIHREVVEKDGILLYEDEAVFQQSGTISRTWAKKGIGTEVKSEPCRESVKAYGAVNVTEEKKPLWHFHFAERVFNVFFNPIFQYSNCELCSLSSHETINRWN